MQLQVCKDREACFFGNSPTLAIVDKTYGRYTAVAWLIPQLADLSLCCGLKEDASKEQLRFVAVAIATDYYWLKVSELMLFFFRFKACHYERFYSRFDPQAILLSLRTFLGERARAYEIRDGEKRRRKNQEQRSRCISFEEYCRLNGLDAETYEIGKEQSSEIKR